MELRVAHPRVRMGRLLPGPPMLLEKGTRGDRSTDSGCWCGTVCAIWMRGGVQDHPGWEAGFNAARRLARAPAQHWSAWATATHCPELSPGGQAGGGRQPTGRDPDTAQGGVGEDRGRWDDDLPKPPAPGSSRGPGSLPSSF